MQQDASQSSRELAQKLGKPSSTVRHRRDRLIRTGAIRIIAVPKPSTMDYEAWAVLGLNVLPGHSERVAQELARFDAVYTVATGLGRFDVVALAQLQTMSELRAFINGEIPKIEAITKSETIVLGKPVKYHFVTWASE